MDSRKAFCRQQIQKRSYLYSSTMESPRRFTMSIPSVGSSGVQKTPATETTDNTSKTNQTTETTQSTKSEPISDSAKGQLIQESSLSGQSRRSQLDTALDKESLSQTDSLKAKEGPDTKSGPAFPNNAAEMAKTSNEDLL